MLSISIGEAIKIGFALPTGSFDSGDFVQAPSNMDSITITPARIGNLLCIMSPYPRDPAKILLLFLKETHCGLHNAGSKLFVLAFDIFGS
jgi:hypothetical protein